MLDRLNFLIMELADARIMCSLWLIIITGYGSSSLVHTLAIASSIRARSERLGHSAGIRPVVDKSDRERPKRVLLL